MTAHLVKEALRRRDNGDERKHQALGYKTPSQIFAADQPVDMWTTQESALPTSPQAQQQQKERDSIYERKVVAHEINRLAALPGRLNRRGSLF